jgi:KDO2-lipid IV(A) lauroyltransferase
MYRNLGRGLLELLLLPFVRNRHAVRIPDATWALVPPGGAVLATAHTGSWDLVACTVARNVPLTVVTKRLHVGILDRIWQRLRRSSGVALLSGPGSARGVARALGRGELVAMIVDQAPERVRAVVSVPFLGAKALVDLAPALCAARAHVPLVAVFPCRAADGTHTVHVPGVLTPPAAPSREWAERAMVQVTLWLEEFVLRHPDQWLWMHRRWKTTQAPDAAACGDELAEVSGVS